jgi:TolA-binding protein
MKRVSGLHLVGGLSTEPPSENRPAGAGLDRTYLTQLLKERRYEEALDIVLKARLQNPNDPAVSRSVRLLKDRLTLKYSERVGSLDRIPECRLSDDVIETMTFTFEERGVLALVDGIATFGDIVDASPQGQFATYRALSLLLDREVILAREASTPIPAKILQQHQQKQKARSAPPPPPVDRSAPPVPEDPSQLLSAWDEEEERERESSKREDTQPMYVMPVLPPEEPPAPAAAPAAAAYEPQLEELELPSHPPLPAPRAVDPPPALPPVQPAAVAPPAPPAPPPPPAAPVSSPPAVDYDALFERATRAYLRRDYDEAMVLFQQYLVVRPNDRRAHHYLEQLRKRRKES